MGGGRAWPRLLGPASARPLCLLRFTPSTSASAKREARPCSRNEFFDELADNLEARSDRYTHQSGPGIIALF